MPRLRKPLEVLELSGVFRPDRHGQRCAAPKSERSIGAPPACLAPDEAAAWCEFVGYCQLRPSKTWGVGRLSTPPGETPMQREAGATAVAVTSRFRSPPQGSGRSQVGYPNSAMAYASSRAPALSTTRSGITAKARVVTSHQ